MQIWEQAQTIDGWNMTKDGIPDPGTEVEILHFGNWPESQIFDTATVDEWGICPHAKDGGHGKRSTVTHWRHVSSNVEVRGASRPAGEASSAEGATSTAVLGAERPGKD